MSNIKFEIYPSDNPYELYYLCQVSHEFIRIYKGYRVSKRDKRFVVDSINNFLLGDPFRITIGCNDLCTNTNRFAINQHVEKNKVKFISKSDRDLYIKNLLIALKLMCDNIEKFDNKKNKGILR